MRAFLGLLQAQLPCSPLLQMDLHEKTFLQLTRCSGFAAPGTFCELSRVRELPFFNVLNLILGHLVYVIFFFVVFSTTGEEERYETYGCSALSPPNTRQREASLPSSSGEMLQP